MESEPSIMSGLSRMMRTSTQEGKIPRERLDSVLETMNAQTETVIRASVS